jgi:hypothetical protein
MNTTITRANYEYNYYTCKLWIQLLHVQIMNTTITRANYEYNYNTCKLWIQLLQMQIMNTTITRANYEDPAFVILIALVSLPLSQITILSSAIPQILSISVLHLGWERKVHMYDIPVEPESSVLKTVGSCKFNHNLTCQRILCVCYCRPKYFTLSLRLPCDWDWQHCSEVGQYSRMVSPWQTEPSCVSLHSLFPSIK